MWWSLVLVLSIIAAVIIAVVAVQVINFCKKNRFTGTGVIVGKVYTPSWYNYYQVMLGVPFQLQPIFVPESWTLKIYHSGSTHPYQTTESYFHEIQEGETVYIANGQIYDPMYEHR